MHEINRRLALPRMKKLRFIAHWLDRGINEIEGSRNIVSRYSIVVRADSPLFARSVDRSLIYVAISQAGK
jgi:hypothetical protein